MHIQGSVGCGVRRRGCEVLRSFCAMRVFSLRSDMSVSNTFAARVAAGIMHDNVVKFTSVN